MEDTVSIVDVDFQPNQILPTIDMDTTTKSSTSIELSMININSANNSSTNNNNNSNQNSHLKVYKARHGHPSCIVDISREKCKKYGFYSGECVETPKGTAVVIGVASDYDNRFNGQLLFHIDGEEGASYWDDIKSYEDVITKPILKDGDKTKELAFQPFNIDEYIAKQSNNSSSISTELVLIPDFLQERILPISSTNSNNTNNKQQIEITNTKKRKLPDLIETSTFGNTGLSELQTLEEELDEYTFELRKEIRLKLAYTQNTCVVCLEKPKTVVFLPCSHLATCDNCSKIESKKCPLCRTRITDNIKVYNS